MPTARIASELGARALRNRTIVRAPIRLYIAGFGWLFGERMLMLEHRGRRSGLPRYVVLEVIEHPEPDRYVVVSGFGETAQWYRNITADPHVHIWSGRRRGVPATATPMTAEESATALAAYATHHPRAWRNLRGMIESATGAPVDQLPMVRVRID